MEAEIDTGGPENTSQVTKLRKNMTCLLVMASLLVTTIALTANISVAHYAIPHEIQPA
jgi:hypothetical protein